MLSFRYRRRKSLHFIRRAWQPSVGQSLSLSKLTSVVSIGFFVLFYLPGTGRVSNIDHSKTPVGSATRKRELGYRPRSGLWQRKTGKHGRKIRKLPPMRIAKGPAKPQPEVLKLTEPSLALRYNNY